MSIERLLDDPETCIADDGDDEAPADDSRVFQPDPCNGVNRYPRFEMLSKAERNRLVRLAKQGDETARRRVILSHGPMALRMARIRGRDGRLDEDTLSAAMIGMIQGIDRYDPDLSGNSSAYIAAYINNEIRLHSVAGRSLIAIKNTPVQQRIFSNLARAKRKLGIEERGVLDWASSLLLSEDLGVPPEQIQEMESRMNVPEFEIDLLDLPWVRALNPLIDDRTTHLDEIAERDGRRRMEDAVRTASRNLSDRERDIVRSRMLATSPESLETLGDRYGVTRERIRQLEEQIVIKLRTAVTAINPDLAMDLGWSPEVVVPPEGNGRLHIGKPFGNDGRRGSWVVVRDSKGEEIASYLKGADGMRRADAYMEGHDFGMRSIAIDPNGLAIVMHRNPRRFDVVHHDAVLSSHDEEPLARAWTDGLRFGFRNSPLRDAMSYSQKRRWSVPLRDSEEERPAWDHGMEEVVETPLDEVIEGLPPEDHEDDDADARAEILIDGIDPDLEDDIDPLLVEEILAEDEVDADDASDDEPSIGRSGAEADHAVVATEAEPEATLPPRQEARIGRRRSDRAVRGFMEWHAARHKPRSMGR